MYKQLCLMLMMVVAVGCEPGGEFRKDVSRWLGTTAASAKSLDEASATDVGAAATVEPITPEAVAALQSADLVIAAGITDHAKVVADALQMVKDDMTQLKDHQAATQESLADLTQRVTTLESAKPSVTLIKSSETDATEKETVAATEKEADLVSDEPTSELEIPNHRETNTEVLSFRTDDGLTARLVKTSRGAYEVASEKTIVPVEIHSQHCRCSRCFRQIGRVDGNYLFGAAKINVRLSCGCIRRESQFVLIPEEGEVK